MALALAVLADRERVAQILANLVDNAVRHARSQVRVGVEADDVAVSFTVDDDGEGIHAADRDHVFERFWSSSTGRRGYERTGLGLAIVRELCLAMGGSVGAFDSPLGGARLVARLPLAEIA